MYISLITPKARAGGCNSFRTLTFLIFVDCSGTQKVKSGVAQFDYCCIQPCRATSNLNPSWQAGTHKTLFHFIQPDLNTREVGRTRGQCRETTTRSVVFQPMSVLLQLFYKQKSRFIIFVLFSFFQRFRSEHGSAEEPWRLSRALVLVMCSERDILIHSQMEMQTLT